MLDQPAQIAQFRLAAMAKAARLKADHGISVARNLPTLAAIRDQYQLFAKTWTGMAADLEGLLAEVESREAECVWIDDTQSVCTFWPAGTCARLSAEVR